MKKTILALASVATLAGAANAQTYNIDLAQALSGGHDVIGDGSLIASIVATQTSNPTGMGSQGSVDPNFANYLVSTDGGRFDFALSYSGSRSADVLETKIEFYGQAPDRDNNGYGDEFVSLFRGGVWNLTANGVQHSTIPGIAWGSVNNSTIGEAVWTSGSDKRWVMHNQVSSASGYDVASQGFANATVSVTPVPEPSSAALLGLGGLALILRRKK